MRKIFESGWGFIIVALLCFITAIMSEKAVTFVSIGGFWVIMAIIVRSKNAKKSNVKIDEETT